MTRTRLLALVLGLTLTFTVEGQQADFGFLDGRSRAVSVAVTTGVSPNEGEIVWPETPGDAWDTSLLSLSVTADAVGTPYIEIASNDARDRQYFPAGDSGSRWLNLSFLRGSVSPGSRVSLRGQGVTLTPGTSTLRLFATRPDLDKTILVLAPHPDDAEIGAFGLYAGRKSTVVTVTSGNAGSPTYEAVVKDPAEQYRFKGRIRLIDSITVPWQGGVPPERAFNMGYFDARLFEMYNRPDEVVPEMYGPNSDIGVYLGDNIGSLLPKKSRESKWTNLVDDMERLLKKVKPSVIAAPHPQLDNHRDHQFTTVALAAALERWNKSVTLLLYTNHADQNRHPYGPAGTLVSMPVIARPVTLDGVYSLPTSPELQQRKLFALESMHDLRFSPTRQYQLAVGEGRAVEPEVQGPGPDITYLRRGPRSNELFFVYDEDTVKPMIAAFLASLPAPKPRP